MPAFTYDQWLIILLIFLLGLIIGMFLMAGGKWKNRYRDEVAKRKEVEAENVKLRKDLAEFESLRHAAARDEIRRRDETPGPL